MSEYEYPLSTGRSNILGTEAFRNLLGESLDKAKEQIIILSAFVFDASTAKANESADISATP